MKRLISVALLSLSLTACSGILTGGSGEPSVRLVRQDGDIDGILTMSCDFDQTPQPITAEQYTTFPQGSSFTFINEGEPADHIIFFAWSVQNGLPDTQLQLQITVPARTQTWTPDLDPGNYMLVVALEYPTRRCYEFWFPVEIT